MPTQSEFGAKTKEHPRITGVFLIELHGRLFSNLTTQGGAADGSRTRTPVRTQAPQACQSTNSSTAAYAVHLNRLIIILSPAGFVNPNLMGGGTIFDGLPLPAQLGVELEGVPVPVGVSEHRFQGDGRQLCGADDRQHLVQEGVPQAAEYQHGLGDGLRGLGRLARAGGQLPQGQVVAVGGDRAHPQAEHGEDLPQLGELLAGAVIHQNGAGVDFHG